MPIPNAISQLGSHLQNSIIHPTLLSMFIRVAVKSAIICGYSKNCKAVDLPKPNMRTDRTVELQNGKSSTVKVKLKP